ncbi:TonB-dependent receptor [Hyphomicrobium sp. LHD-15]|uniref:TonB-dependent receptor n=1 Tax=Hyphomicrobium sp. LHD-15 TaxID=3072142 RepID=UPI00280CC352|nr:TonB-dependent receptor [Hyphomicrobium sp. LHD-15]MDQ8698470.1 TonB-dependent receptor [Hyphomicrobium sp. LHD-15]
MNKHFHRLAKKSHAVGLFSFSCLLTAMPFSSARAQEANSQPVALPPLVVETPKAAKAKKATAGKKAPTTVSAQPQQPVAPEKSPEQIANDPTAGAADAAAAKLQIKNNTGSALGLTPEETPATVNIVTQRDIEEKGARGLVETFRTIPGVVVGNNPGEPGTTVTRGFYKATGFSIDGSRTADPVFLPRDYSSFHFDRVEVLKGPASVVSGTSGLAGSFNIVTKQATTDRNFSEAMVSYGSFDTVQTGVGTNIVLSPDAALRSTFSFSGSNGFIDDTESEKFGFTNNLLLKPTDRLKITASVDYFKDDFSTAYYGTPLIDRSVARNPTGVVSSSNGLVLDKSIRDKNYDFEDGKMESESVWMRGAADYKLSENWTLRNELNYYSADRLWRDADYYSYSAGLITRGTTLISHDHEFWSDRMVLSFDGLVGGVRNRFAAGAEYMETSFGTTRRFGSTPGVDIFDPDRGTYPFGTLGTQQSADHVTKAVFAENAVNLTPSWLVSAGIRYETIDLDRTIVNEMSGAAVSFGNEFESTTWRIGTTYEILKGTSVFAQYAEAVVPITALMTSSLSNAQFELSTGNSVELGIKSTLFGGRVTTTTSIYEINQDDIITRTSASVSIQGGSQRSRGIEAEAAIDLTSRWNLSLSGTLIDAEFTELRAASGTDLTGNRPVNSVPWAWSALTTYRLESVPATLGAQLTGVGPFYTSNANLYEAQDRTVLDAWIAFDVGQGTLTLRGRNLTDEFYAEWADYNETSLYVGAPRSFDVTYSVKW